MIGFYPANVRRASVLLGALLVAACAGSKHTSTPSTPSAPGSTSQAAPPVTTIRTTRTGTTRTRTPRTRRTARSATKTAASVNARVPARFTITAGGGVTPPTVTVPAHFAVGLSVTSGDGRPHRAVLRGNSLAVPVHGHASRLLRGLPAGSYPLKVDGVPRGMLTIGGSPGP